MRWQSPLGIALIYATLAASWIVGSGAVLGEQVSDPLLADRVELLKGLVFVAVTGVLLFVLLSRRNAVLGAGSSSAADELNFDDRRSLMPIMFLLALAAPLVAIGVYAVNSAQEERETFTSLATIADGRVTYANPRAAEIFGYTQDEALGRPLLELVAERDHARVAEIVQRREGGGLQRVQYEFAGSANCRRRSPRKWVATNCSSAACASPVRCTTWAR
jgi:PAS domain S-box-containing protein